MTQQIYGFTGRYTWFRRRVWSWQAKALAADGWYESRAERMPFRPMMIKRVEMADLQSQKTAAMREMLDTMARGV